ncbi:TRAF3-interacting protein 1 [Aphidius gifuensis]|uniref:TRAF3-interacting protein 1 n=1 Tax=Aphidius gifuensis TaxID=684658 RepID=UPI001CDB4BC7|nr:TRAF3-interacting protein 1 [Aphidius gifuensis]
MSEEIKLQESIKKTQDLLGKYIKKPPLTEKLLRKPPFRFLHDIVTAVVKETGFLKGLFNEFESNSVNIKEKDAKLSYLTKLIDVVKLITGNDIGVRASKIISGQEPIKTNELLQAIGKALNKKISSVEAIEHYKKSGEKKTNTSKLKKSSSPQEKSNKAHGSSEERVKKSISSDENGKKSTSKRTPSSERVSSKEKSKSKDEKIRRGSKDHTIDKKEIKIKENKKKDSSDSIKTSRKNHESITSGEKLKKKKQKPSSHENISIEEISNEPVDENLEAEKENHLEIDKIEEKNSTIPVKAMNLSTESNNLNEKNLESQIILESKMPLPANETLRPPSVRPSSARPGAPRIRGKNEFVIKPNALTQMGDVNVIVETFDTKEDDQDGMVVMETMSNYDNTQMGSTDLLNNQLTQEHGYLVAQILETQRELVNEGNVDIIPNKVQIEWDIGLKKDRDTVVKEIDKLRGAIQTLTRTTNPLGKLFDFLQEDVEIMEKELMSWRNQYKTINEQLQIEKNSIKESIKPLEESLREIENSVKLQKQSIYQIKGNIIRNQEKIHKLLTGE